MPPCPRPSVPKLQSKLKVAMKRFLLSKPDKHNPFSNLLWFERNVNGLAPLPHELAGKTDKNAAAAATTASAAASTASQMLPNIFLLSYGFPTSCWNYVRPADVFLLWWSQ